ncbi:MAG: peptidase, partial [Sphingobacteriia bacterium]|nr:peptidase [Sphingobacteriia bacterium]
MNPDVLKALGLAEGAAAADAVAAIEKLKTDQQLALNRAQHPDPAAWVPRADHQLALN